MEAILIAVGVVIFAILLGFVLVPYLKSKGYINDKNTEVTKLVLQLTDMIMKNSEFKNKDKALLVIDIARIAVNYVEQTSRYDSNEEKKEVAKKAVLETLKTMEIDVGSDIMRLVEMGIESSVNQLPPTYGKTKDIPM